MQQVHSPPPARRAALALLVLLASATFVGTVPAASGQIIIALASGDADRTFGWTFPDDAPIDAELADPAGDLTLSAGPAPATVLPADAVLAENDLVGLTIHEVDEEIVLFRVQLAGLEPQGGFWFGRPTYELRFTLGGVQHRVTGGMEDVCVDSSVVCEAFTDPKWVLNARLDRQEIDGSWSARGAPPSRVLADADAFEVLLPRWALERAGAGGAHPLAGDTITDLQVTARAGGSIIGGVAETSLVIADQLPDDAPATNVHTLKMHSLGSVVSVALAGGHAEIEGTDDLRFQAPPIEPRQVRVDVDLERSPRIPIEVHNRFARSALVVPAVTLDDAPAGWRARVTQSLTVPSGETRGFDIILVGNGTLDPATPARLGLKVHTLGTGAGTTHMDRLDILVRDVPALHPQHNRLYLHTTNAQTFLAEAPGTMFTYSDGLLNTLEDDPADNGIGSTLGIGCLCNDQIREWSSIVSVLDPLFVDGHGNVTFHATIEAPVAGALELRPDLFYDDTFVAGDETMVDLAQGTNTIDLNLPVQEDAQRLDASQNAFQLQLFSVFRPVADVLLLELTNLAHETNPRLMTSGDTWVELPLVAHTERFASVDHLSVDLQRGYETVRYVNPGRTALWNVTVLNQGDQTDTITVTAAVDADTGAADWATDTRPGRSFRLEPGEAVTVGVQARAPAAAREGDTARLNVTVASALANGNGAGIRLSAVVTDGVDIAETMYVADNETSARVVSDAETKGSPGLATVPVLITLGLGLAGVRRRSEGRRP